MVNCLLGCAKMWFPIDKEGLLISVEKLVDSADFEASIVNNKLGKKWYNFLKRHSSLSPKYAKYLNKARGTMTEQKIRELLVEVSSILIRWVLWCVKWFLTHI